MKILLLVPNLHIGLVEYLKERNSYDGTELEIHQFDSGTDESQFDTIFIFPGDTRGVLKDQDIVDTLPDKIAWLFMHNTNVILLLRHHYSCDYSHITFPNRVVTKSLLLHPYYMLKMLVDLPVYEKSQLNTSIKSCILSCDNKIVCCITSTELSDTMQKLMPIIPTRPDVKSNFDINSFLRHEYLSIRQIKELGDQFWDLQFYFVWDNFYDQVY